MIDLTRTDWMAAGFDLGHAGTEIVIGDVHGCLEQLSALVGTTLDQHPDAAITFLGDLADRGPHSVGCLALAADTVLRRRSLGHEAVFLPGNHEQLLFGAIMPRTTAAYAGILAGNGGGWLAKVLARREFGQSAIDILADAVGGGAAMNILSARGELLSDLIPCAAMHRRVGNVLMVHGGVDPEAADPERWICGFPALPDKVDDYHPLWIRRPFYEHRGPYGRNGFVVHGHTFEWMIPRGETGLPAPVGQHRLDGYRLGLDGGSFHTGHVAAAIIQTGRYRTLTASRHG